ncbi:hypothetical protein FHP24_12895 [Aliirhizobium smilacinae]|uniref:Uncharacterized protein n=1 Tax=Aliirhizobium smilacinae TaxID=1395944 RepID=A0A5C4XKU9_9HYPH|nr:hypothetical protein FHP24_12895 [Rhizobium smilacinae]
MNCAGHNADKAVFRARSPDYPHSCACHRNPATARLRREKTLSAQGLGLLDSCDKHRNEGGFNCRWWSTQI